MEALFQILLNNTDIKDTKLDSIKQSTETIFPSIQESLNISLKITEDIADIGNKYNNVCNTITNIVLICI